MNRTLIVVAGVSGVGKTRKRTNAPELKELPCVDMADVYRDLPLAVWPEQYFIFETRLWKLFTKHPTVVAEGYFVPNSTTRRWLLDSCINLGIRVEFIDMHAPLETCLERVAASGVDVASRTEVLRRVWPQAEAEYQRGKVKYEYSV